MPREHKREVRLPVGSDVAFALLIKPSHICNWWSAEYAIVIPDAGGTWTAAWGSDRDEPDYITSASIRAFEPGRLLELSDYRYYSKDGELPFEADFVTTFLIEPADSGTVLQVTQAGFPDEPGADDFYRGCEEGWKNTLSAMLEYASKLA